MADYGPKESTKQEGLGLLLIMAGITAFAADWAYADGVVQVIFILLGIASFIAGFGALRAAKKAG
ncbi:MAG TPA: hypothetical protein VMV93_02260 [Chloroflexota bacterium]|nr:hypothetical protein [Chloroflexota bacterium]